MTILALSIGVAFLAFAVSRLKSQTRKTNAIDESLYEGVNGTFLRK